MFALMFAANIREENMKNHFKLLSAVAALAFAGQVSAATTYTTWTVGQSASVVAGNNSAVTSTSTGWADTGAGTPRVIEQQTVISYPGLGIKNLDACGTAPCDIAELDPPEQRDWNTMVLPSKAVTICAPRSTWISFSDSGTSGESRVNSSLGIRRML